MESNIFWRERKKKYCVVLDLHLVHLYYIFSFSWNLFRSCRFSRGIKYFWEREEEKILCCVWFSFCTFISHILLLLKSKICFDLTDFPVENILYIFWRRRKKKYCVALFILRRIFSFSWNRKSVSILPIFPWNRIFLEKGKGERKKRYCAVLDLHLLHLYRIFSFSWNRKSVSILPIFL